MSEIFQKLEARLGLEDRICRQGEGVRIAFGGRMGAGKSTLAREISQFYSTRGVNFKTDSFAEGVREVARDLFGMTRKDRGLLISIGNKMREIDPDVWAKRVVRGFDGGDEGGGDGEVGGEKYCLVDDLRYPNEARYLREAGFILVYLDIDRETQLERLQKTYPSTWKDHVEYLDHFTENGPDSGIDFDLILLV